jgi:hypothetical protein
MSFLPYRQDITAKPTDDTIIRYDNGIFIVDQTFPVYIEDKTVATAWYPYYNSITKVLRFFNGDVWINSGAPVSVWRVNISVSPLGLYQKQSLTSWSTVYIAKNLSTNNDDYISATSALIDAFITANDGMIDPGTPTSPVENIYEATITWAGWWTIATLTGVVGDDSIYYTNTAYADSTRTDCWQMVFSIQVINWAVLASDPVFNNSSPLDIRGVVSGSNVDIQMKWQTGKTYDCRTYIRTFTF